MSNLINAFQITKVFSRNMSKLSTKRPIKVTICGAGGKVGQPLSLLLKLSPLVEELSLHDANPVCGFAMELSHVDSICKVTAHEKIKDALRGAKIVVVVAAAPNTSHLPFHQMFEPNCQVIKEIAQGIGQNADPGVLVAVATNPLNSMVPALCEFLKKHKAYDPRKVFGITSLNVIRANTFVAEVQGLTPEDVVVPVIGGNDGRTIVPLLSYAEPCPHLTNPELELITKKLQSAHFDIVKEKGKTSENLSAAYAISKFVFSLIKGLKGYTNVIECAYVRSKAHPNSKYLATPLLLGRNGLEKNLGIPKLTEYESCQIENAVHLLREDIKKGEACADVQDPAPCDICDPARKGVPCPDYCIEKPL